MLAGNTAFKPTSYESIATVTVGSGGASSVEFTSIPATYKHLQIRILSRSDGANSDIDSLAMRVNGDTGSNYAYHFLKGSGAAASAAAGTSSSVMILGAEPSANHTSGMFAGHVVDILDYADTNKYKTVRSIGGVDTNNTGNEVGEVRFSSSLWMSTSAITSLKLQSGSAFTKGFTQYSHFALYGIKGA
jgi:hypothetical protein